MISKTMLKLAALAALLSALLGSSNAQLGPCTDSGAEQAGIEADTLRSWDTLNTSYGLYRGCDDGFIAEGYSESVARILVDHWNTLPRLVHLSKQDAGFRDFVLRHVDSTLDVKDLTQIKKQSTVNCAKASFRTCSQLRKQALAALAEKNAYIKIRPEP